MKKSRLLVSLIVFVLAGCTDSPEPVAKSSVEEPSEKAEILEPVELEVAEKVLDQNEAFDAFKQEFLMLLWELDPSRAVLAGYYKHDDQLLVPNGELRARKRGFYVNELLALKKFDANQLTKTNASDLAIIESELRARLWYIDEYRSFEWNPAQYNPAGAFGVILNTDYKPLPERLMVINRRLANVPDYYQAAIKTIKSPTLEHLDLALQQGAGVVNMFETLIPAKVNEADLSEQQQAELSTNLAGAVTATKGYLSWLKAKRAQLSELSSARNFRLGAELYEQKFKHDIESSYTAEGLYQRALTAKNKLHDDMIRITGEIWEKYFPETPRPAQDLVAVKMLIDKLSEKHIGRDQFVDEIKRQIPIIQQYVDENNLLDSDPSRPLVVRLTPEYQRGIAGASINAPGPYDATANTYYNVSPLDGYTDEQAESYLREYNHWILQILNIHEAVPGHYTQLMHANKSPSKIKSIFANGAMIEGWAVYSERMMLEEGYADDEPEMWLMYSKWNLRVVVNAILDYSVHVLGMQREQALDLLINEAFQQQTEAEGKWRRVTVSQVQLTSYFSGYSEIYAYREELKQLLGEAFDLKEFHNLFLSYGNAPVPVIKKLMTPELEQKKANLEVPLEQMLLRESAGKTGENSGEPGPKILIDQSEEVVD